MKTPFTHLLAAIILAVLPSGFASAQAQDSLCADVVQKAEQAYFNIQFDEAASLLESCKASIQDADEQKDAYLLLARIHFSTQELVKSRMAINELLLMDLEYQLPDFLPPPFVQYFEDTQVRYHQHSLIAERLRPVPDYKTSIWQRIDRHWYWVGGGLVVASAAALLTNGDSGNTFFAPPPAPPTNAIK